MSTSHQPVRPRKRRSRCQHLNCDFYSYSDSLTAAHERVCLKRGPISCSVCTGRTFSTEDDYITHLTESEHIQRNTQNRARRLTHRQLDPSQAPEPAPTSPEIHLPDIPEFVPCPEDPAPLQYVDGLFRSFVETEFPSMPQNKFNKLLEFFRSVAQDERTPVDLWPRSFAEILPRGKVP